MSARTHEKVLADAGVPEGRNPKYMTSARSMFAALATRAIGKMPAANKPSLDSLAENATRFVERMWTLLERGDIHQMMQIAGRLSAGPTRNGGFSLRQGIAHIGGPEFMPSTRQAKPVTRSIQAHMDIVAEQGRLTVEAAIASVIDRIPADVVIRGRHFEPPRAWFGASLEMVIDGVASTMASWGCAELIHRHIDDRIRKAAGIPDSIVRAEQTRKDFLAVIPHAQAELDKLVPDDLPVTLSIGRNVKGLNWEAGAAVTIVCQGYGPGGMPSTISVASFGHKNFDGHRSIVTEIEQQKERHKIYGPKPGSWAGGWTLDLITARLLATSSTGAKTIAAAIANGQATDPACNMTVSIAGPGRLAGSGHITPEAMWSSGEIRVVGVDLPETLLDASVGKPIETVVGGDTLAGAGIIRRAWKDSVHQKPRARFAVTSQRVTVIKER